VAYFSNFGPKTVAIAAPGEEIVSTLPNNSYGPMEGTSMATPFVAGAAGLLKSMYPQLQGVQLKDRLLLTAVDRERLSKQVLFGRLSLTRLMEDRFAPAMPVPSIAVSDVGKSFLRLKGSGLDGFKGYEVRWSESPFDSEKKWEESRRLLKSVEPFSGNASQVLKISGFPINAKGFIGLRFWDELGNRTPLDQGEKFSLLPMDFFYEVLPDQNEGVDFLGGWGREKVVGRGVVFSDSPNGVYGYERENHFELPPIQVPNDEMVLAFECKFDFELGFDFGELAVSQDKGETWKVIQRWTGSQNWHTETLPLKDFLRSSAPALLRFRTLSDRTTSKDGWQISRIQGWK
jgi:hypothetical protein